MSNFFSEDELARARQDPAFRQHLMAESLERLLEALNHARRHGNKSPESARLIREGVDLAVELANRLSRTSRRAPSPPRAARSGTAEPLLSLAFSSKPPIRRALH